MRNHFAAVALALTTLGAATLWTANVQGAETLTLHRAEKNLIDATNAQRGAARLSGVEIDAGLMASARAHAQWMASNRRLQHSRDRVAENIAEGQESSAQAISDWMRSPGHRANILNGRHSRIGVGWAADASGRLYWCQQFASGGVVVTIVE